MSGALRTWTQVTGVFDTTDDTMRLYVNGVAQGDPVDVPAEAAAGVVDLPTEVGRVAFTPGTYANYYRGRVDELHAWKRALTSDEIASEAGLLDANGVPQVELTGQWDPADAATTATSLADLSGYGRPLALDGAVLDGENVVLDGTNDAATATGPVIDVPWDGCHGGGSEWLTIGTTKPSTSGFPM